MADLNLQKVDLSSIKAIAHDGISLNVLIEHNGGYCLESLAAPPQAFQGLQQLAQFASLLQQSDNGLTARKQLLDQIRMIPEQSAPSLYSPQVHRPQGDTQRDPLLFRW